MIHQELFHIATSDWFEIENDSTKSQYVVRVDSVQFPKGTGKRVILPLYIPVHYQTIHDYLKQGGYNHPSEDKDEIRCAPYMHILNRIIKHFELYRRYPKTYGRRRHQGFITKDEANDQFLEPPDF